MRQSFFFAAFGFFALSPLLFACGGQSEPASSAGAGAGGANDAGSGGASAGNGGSGLGGQSDPGGCKPSTVKRCIGGKIVDTGCCSGPFDDSCMPAPITACPDGSCAASASLCPGGQGGGGTGGAGACGTEPPAKGAPCEAGQECTWGDRFGVCGPDGWFIGQKTGTQLAPNAPCNPLGKWDLSYEPAEATGVFCTEPYEPDLEVRTSTEGSLVAEFLDGMIEISSDGCSIKASTHQSFTNPSESWSSSTAIELKLQGDQGSGTYTKSNGGFCNGNQQGQLSAKRLLAPSHEARRGGCCSSPSSLELPVGVPINCLLPER